MRKAKKVTAEDLVRQLAADSEYQAALEAQRRRSADLVAAERPVLRDLDAAGYPVRSLDEVVKLYAPLPPAVCNVLLKGLGQTLEARIQDMIVRALSYVQEGFDVRPLTRLFETTADESLRWAIANTLAELRPLDAREWVVAALARGEYGRAREMLPLALARIAPAVMANEVLLRYLDEMPGHVAIALKESGGLVEAEALRTKAATQKGWVKKELEQASRAIERRLR